MISNGGIVVAVESDPELFFRQVLEGVTNLKRAFYQTR